MGIGDLNLVMRNGAAVGNLTATETGGVTANTTRIDTGALALGIGGGGVHIPMVFAVIVPTAGSAGNGFVFKLQHSDDDTTYEDLVFLPEQAWAGGLVGTGVSASPLQIFAVGEYRVHFVSRRRYWRYVATITGTPNMGAVVIRVEKDA